MKELNKKIDFENLEQKVEMSGDGSNIGGVPCGVVVVAVAVYSTPAG